MADPLATARIIRPLGRSLDPLPGESLSGLVLRLSHQLRISPDRVVRDTGLADIQDNTQSLTKPAWAIILPADKTADFANATRLTPSETTALTLASWASHYPPIARTQDYFHLGRPTRQLDGLFTTTARYCPACLAGDGSPLQNLHGGPWRREWRLPVFFLCPQHQCFLEHLCPTCHQPIGSRSNGQLIARPTIPGLHPAQCRQPRPHTEKRPRSPEALCQGRLDQIELHAADRPEPELITLQEKITSMLRPEHSAELASQYFTELQLVAALAIITWPLTRPGAPTTTVNAADLYAADQVAQEPRKHSNAPPTNARACAAFLHAADTILGTDDLRAALAPLAPVENRTRTGITPKRHLSWDLSFKNHRDACSDRFQHVAETLVPSFRRTKPGGRRIPLSRVGYGPEHVPAFLPQEWADRHLSVFTGISTRLLRRTAATYLVRRAQGRGLNEAAQFLGISTSDKSIGFGTVLSRWSRAQDNLHAFDMAVDAIAADLESSPPRRLPAPSASPRHLDPSTGRLDSHGRPTRRPAREPGHHRRPQAARRLRPHLGPRHPRRAPPLPLPTGHPQRPRSPETLEPPARRDGPLAQPGGRTPLLPRPEVPPQRLRGPTRRRDRPKQSTAISGAGL